LLICNTDVESANDPVVDEAIRAAIDGFHEEGRVFPHGQLRINRKKLEEHDTSKTQGFLQDIPTEELQKYDNDDFAVMTVEKRLSLVRLQSVRRTLIQPSDDKVLLLSSSQ
uniref:Ubiquitinyl hydrolase 1 n=1 Tax=Anisakis simplex TaxID=6269 RepID=A0A0M3JBC1_ANISI